ICALRPGLAGVSDRIEVVSVVDRYLEHSRIYYFLNGGDDQVFLASADMMTRNLDRRIELMFPIERPPHKLIVVNALRAMFHDNVKARRLDADGVYRPVERTDREPPFREQQVLLEEAQRRAAQARERAGVTFHPELGGKSGDAATPVQGVTRSRAPRKLE